MTSSTLSKSALDARDGPRALGLPSQPTAGAKHSAPRACPVDSASHDLRSCSPCLTLRAGAAASQDFAPFFFDLWDLAEEEDDDAEDAEDDRGFFRRSLRGFFLSFP